MRSIDCQTGFNSLVGVDFSSPPEHDEKPKASKRKYTIDFMSLFKIADVPLSFEFIDISGPKSCSNILLSQPCLKSH